ncbi:aminoglycoside N(3)-acetyltransferase [Streptomyces sp. cmx-4-9]|uniref:aminoglycoside N(3)-acetyltransferase n=1 Tax=Streptomyces sp. cmx-4-9 TaxID=2790941 RepID=UPI00397F7BD1
MLNPCEGPVDGGFLQKEFEALGLPRGAVVMVHASLSAFGSVQGGAHAVLNALRGCVGESGTVVVPTFTPQISDPHPGLRPFQDSGADADRLGVPLFHDALPTPMGAIPNAALAVPGRLRGRHPQASVAAIGPRAEEITGNQPLNYALGKDSPFDRMYGMGAHILLLGVGHNRNSFLHYAESLVPEHRTKLRRFPYAMGDERVWVEAPDVGDDNGRFFPQLGAEADAAGLIRHRTIGLAPCQLMDSIPFIDFTGARLAELLAQGRQDRGR